MEGCYLMPHPPIIVPEVGKGEESKVKETIKACMLVGNEIEKLEAETIIIVTPHGVVFKDAVAMVTANSLSGDLRKFGAPEIGFNYEIDMELTTEIINKSRAEGILVGELDERTSQIYNVPLELDHGAIVPLYYADKSTNHKLIHITYGLLSPLELMRFGIAIKKAVEVTNKKAVFIASGDLSHRLTKDGPYEYSPYGVEFDTALIDKLSCGNLSEIFNINKHLITEAGECGLRSIYIMAGALNSSKVSSKLYNYEGPLGVGYAVMSFKGEDSNLYKEIAKLKEDEHKRRMKDGNPYTRLARENLDRYFRSGQLVEIDELEDEALTKDRKGVFVSLKINGELRGCIGTIEATTSCVGEEIIRNSLSAALNDPRFPAVKYDELLDIDISVDLLYEAEPTTYEQLDPENYGVIVTSGNKRGLLLPNLEGINTKEQQVEIAKSKGNISEKDKYSLERFKVERYKEVESDE